MRFPLILLTSLFFTSCVTTTLPPLSQTKPGVAAEGSLANEKLIADTTIALAQITGQPRSARLLKFVIQQPVGKPGSRAWRELWTYAEPQAKTSAIITFTEKGLGAADFTISLNEPQ